MHAGESYKHQTEQTLHFPHEYCHLVSKFSSASRRPKIRNKKGVHNSYHCSSQSFTEVLPEVMQSWLFNLDTPLLMTAVNPRRDQMSDYYINVGLLANWAVVMLNKHPLKMYSV